MDYILKVDIESTKYLSFLYNNYLIKTSLLIILGLYFIISPKLSNIMYLLYNNIVFRFLIIYIIIFLSYHDLQLSVIVAFIYLLILNKYNKQYKLNNTHLN